MLTYGNQAMLTRLITVVASIGAILTVLGLRKRQALAQDIQGHDRTAVATSGQGLRACFVSQRNYPSDQRLYTAMSALRDAGWEVHIICARDSRPAYSVEDNFHIHRLPSIERTRGSKLRYVAEYLSFIIPAFLMVSYLHLKLGFHVVEVTNLPDPLLLSALVPRLMGAKVIFDMRECSPEMFNDRLGLSFEGKPMQAIIALEQAMVRFAHATIICTEQMKQAVVRRGASADKIAVTLNSGMAYTPVVVLPDPADNTALTDLHIVTHGTIIKRYGHHYLIRALPYVREVIPNAHITIYGKGAYRPELEQMIADMGLTECIKFGGFVPDSEVVARLHEGHIGVVTLEKTPEADLVHTYKMFEYLSLGIPVVIGRTSAVAGYFTPQEVTFFEPGDERDLARALIELAKDPQRRHQQAMNGLLAYERYHPEKQKQATLEIVTNLIQRA
jgi:glycosyltransferase involved in cell wall biosynthesis